MPIPAGSALLLSVDAFALRLGNPNIDVDRAGAILQDAQDLCQEIVDPLPAKAALVIFDVAARAFTNPAPSHGQSFGLYTEDQGPFNEATPGAAAGGLYLSRYNIKRLKRMAGRSAAFSVDMLPATLPGLPPWDTGDDLATLLDLP